jgi:beta-galactosidase/beta-glucuronidase
LATEVGRYSARFAIPASWREKRVEIVFDGAMTDTDVRVNGRSAGPTHQGAFYRFRHDISHLLSYGDENHLEVDVAKVSANASVNAAERQPDYWIFGGIFRPVWLEAHPVEHIERVALDPKHTGDFHAEVYTRGLSGPAEVVAQVRTLAGEPV